MQWINEIEMVDLLNDFKSLSSIRSISMSNSEILDAKMASTLNKIICNSHFKIYFENYSHVFTVSSRNGSELFYQSRRIPSDDILEKIVQIENTRVWEVQDRNEIVLYEKKSQKKAGPDYHRLKTMVKRSVKQNSRKKNFEARNGNHEACVVVKNQETPCVKGDNCYFCHDVNKRVKSTHPKSLFELFHAAEKRNASRTRSPRGNDPNGRMFRWPHKHYLDELAPIFLYPSLGMIGPNEPHQRNPNVPKFEDRSQKETEWQEQGARETAWKLAKSVLKLEEHESTTFFSPSENTCLPSPTTSIKPEERHRSPTDEVVQSYDNHNPQWRVQTHEEAIVYVKELDIFLTMKVLENTPAVLSLGELCDEHGYPYEWINGQKPHLI